MKKIFSALFVLVFGILNAQQCFQTVTPPAGYFFTYSGVTGQNISKCANNDVLLSCVLTDSNTYENSNAVIRYNQSMSVIWSKKINVSGFYDNPIDFNRVMELPNGDIYVYFTAYDDDYYAYHYAMRLTSTGDMIWSKNFYVDYNSNPYGPPKLKMSSTGDLLVVLSYWESVHVVKVNSQGTIDFGYDILTDSTKNPGFDCELRSDCSIITAKSNSDCELIKINNSGNVVWAKRFHDTTFYTQPRSICNTMDGNFLVAGLINTDNTNGLLMKIDSSGAILWTKEYSSASLGVNGFDKVVEMPNGNILLYEYTESKILECDANGNILHTKVMDVQNTMAYDLEPTNFLFMGTKYVQTLNDYAVVFVNDNIDFTNPSIFMESNEMSAATSSYNPTISDFYSTQAMDFADMPDSAVLISNLNISLIMTDNCMASTGIATVETALLNVFPNPASSEITIDLENSRLNGPVDVVLCDVNGNTVKSVLRSDITSLVKVGLSNLSNGMYFLKVGVSGDAPALTKRVVVSH